MTAVNILSGLLISIALLHIIRYLLLCLLMRFVFIFSLYSQGVKSHSLAQHSKRIWGIGRSCTWNTIWTCDQRASAEGQESSIYRNGRRDIRHINGILLYSEPSTDARSYGLCPVLQSSRTQDRSKS